MKNLDAVILIPFAEGQDYQIPDAEAKYFYEEHFKDADAYQITNEGIVGRMYVKDNIGMYILGQGKSNASISATSLLTDKRFNFDNTTFILFGCCGGASEISAIGDLYLISSVVDFDLGYHADFLEENNVSNNEWFNNSSYDDFAKINLDDFIVGKAWNIIKDKKLKNFPEAQKYISNAFNNEQWTKRDPKVMKGTSVTSDSYWKGVIDHDSAVFKCNFYGCKDPYVSTQMEDNAIALSFKRHNMLDKLIMLRYAVNLDVFLPGQNTKSLWTEDSQNSTNDQNSFNLNGLFNDITKSATDACWDLIVFIKDNN